MPPVPVVRARSALVWTLLVLLPGCGRFGFEPAPAVDSATGPDAGPGDAAPPDRGVGDLTPAGDGPADAADASAPGVPTFSKIPSGTFQMGSPTSEPCRSTGEDLHTVQLTHEFELAETETTQAQYQALMGANPSYFKTCGSSCPVDFVSWHQAAAYCNAVSAKLGKAPCYSCSGSGMSTSCALKAAYAGAKIYSCTGYRLPTEAEWEHAYRAGTSTPLYNGSIASCTGKDAHADAIGWYASNTAKVAPRPVRGLKPNGLGLYDMAGNMTEWVHDLYQASLGTAKVTDPWGAASGTRSAVRGGSWYSEPGSLRGAHRKTALQRNSGFNFTGFRCARTR